MEVDSNELYKSIKIRWKLDYFFPSSAYSLHWIQDYNAEKLKDKEIIEKLLSGVLDVKVGHNIGSIWYNIKYKVFMNNDNIDVMSLGKKALVLLKLLIDFVESKFPILIDHTENDLDNRSVFLMNCFLSYVAIKGNAKLSL